MPALFTNYNFESGLRGRGSFSSGGTFDSRTKNAEGQGHAPGLLHLESVSSGRKQAEALKRYPQYPFRSDLQVTLSKTATSSSLVRIVDPLPPCIFLFTETNIRPLNHSLDCFRAATFYLSFFARTRDFDARQGSGERVLLPTPVLSLRPQGFLDGPPTAPERRPPVGAICSPFKVRA